MPKFTHQINDGDDCVSVTVHYYFTPACRATLEDPGNEACVEIEEIQTHGRAVKIDGDELGRIEEAAMERAIEGRERQDEDAAEYRRQQRQEMREMA